MRRAALSAGLAAALATALLLGIAAAYGATTAKHYKGRTSQHEPVSFTISAGLLKHLGFWIDVTCPSRRVYRIHDFNFPDIKIKQATFDQAFSSKAPKATARIRGRVHAKSVTGTLTDQTMIEREHHFCGGRATFRLFP